MKTKKEYDKFEENYKERCKVRAFNTGGFNEIATEFIIDINERLIQLERAHENNIPTKSGSKKGVKPVSTDHTRA